MLKSTPDNKRRAVPSHSDDDNTPEISRDSPPQDAPHPANQPLAEAVGDVETAHPRQRVVSLFLQGEARARVKRAVQSGGLHQVAQADVLAEARLPALAVWSLWLLIGSTVVFSALISLARYLSYSGTLLGNGAVIWRVLLFILLNVVAYVVMIFLHEGVHALAIFAQGGRPRFGLRLPIAAYCTAPNQLFTRNGYIAVALAPLVALTLASLVVVWLTPNVAACLLLGIAGNISGAVGDLAVVNDMRRLSAETLIADTETRYIAYSAEG